MKEKIKETLIKFCELMFEKYEIQSVKVIVELKNKTKIKHKQFIKNG